MGGHLPEFALPAFFGASLIALQKKDGGLRPIAVGSVYRRITAKVATSSVYGQIGAELRPVQLGVATRNGCEAAVHAVRAYIQQSEVNEDRILVKLDVSNAFNSVRRDSMLEAVRARTPGIYPLVWQGNSQAAPLFIGEDQVMSKTGVQQGDPLSSLLFSLTIDTATRAADTDINVWYLDDGTLAGPLPSVLTSIERVRKEVEKCGLHLNGKKCEVAFLGGPEAQQKQKVMQQLHGILPDANEVYLDDLELLGAPIGDSRTRHRLLLGKQDVQKLTWRLRELEEPHQAFFLVKNCVSLPRLLYLLRSSPACRQLDLLTDIDEIVRRGLKTVTNVQLRDDAWRQATLPVSLGGL